MKLNEYNSATSVYLQQIIVYIETGEGYNTLRKYLFKDLNQTNDDDRLPDSIVVELGTKIKQLINFHQSEKVFRAIQVVEDLLTYAQQIMSPAMHCQHFVGSLLQIAKPKIITFNSVLQNQNRMRVLGIFLFWFSQYGNNQDGYYMFIEAYQQFRDQKMLFPNYISIKPSNAFKKQKVDQIISNTSTDSNIIVLNDIEDFTLKTEQFMRQSIRSIVNTEYVRLIKHKSKVLYNFTTNGASFNSSDKNRVKDCYKRLRFVLKQIDKFNEVNVQLNKVKIEQQIYIQKKVEGLSPKKEDQLKIESNKKIQSQPFDLLGNESANIIKKNSNQQNLNSAQTAKEFNQNINSDNAPQINLLGIQNSNEQKLNQEDMFVDAILVELAQQTRKQSQEQKKVRHEKQLFEIFASPKKQNDVYTPKKDKHQENQEELFLKKGESGKSNSSAYSFENEKMGKNPYSYIPQNLNLTPTSSVGSKDDVVLKEDVGFNIFGYKNEAVINNKLFLEVDEKYDDYHSPHIQNGQPFNQAKDQNQIFNQKQQIIDSPPKKNIKAVDYQQYAFHKTPESINSENEYQKMQKSPSKQSEGNAYDELTNSNEKVKTKPINLIPQAE